LQGIKLCGTNRPHLVKGKAEGLTLLDDLNRAKSEVPLNETDAFYTDLFREKGFDCILLDGSDGSSGQWLLVSPGGIFANNAAFTYQKLTLEMVSQRTHMLAMGRR